MGLEEKVISHFRVPNEMHGLRADQYLQRRIGRISRERAQRIIMSEDFLLDGSVVKPSSRVRAGQEVSLKRFAPDQVNDVDNFTVDIIFEDDDLLVINKPPHMSIHPSANCLYKTVTHWLRTNFPTTKINPCHRIDKETSGLVVCAKNRAAEALVKKAFMYGRVKKTYLAIVNGEVLTKQTIAYPLSLQKDRGLVAIRMVHDQEGKDAITNIRPLRFDAITKRSLVLCHPLTGRQHQIRAHLSLIGHPLVGDKLYEMGDEFFDKLSRGFVDVKLSLSHPRHALHAARIRFQFKNRRVFFAAPLPQDLLDLIAMS